MQWEIPSGAVRIENWINKHGDLCGPVDDTNTGGASGGDPEPPTGNTTTDLSCCEEIGKPYILHLQYTGGDCASSDNEQSDVNFHCSGDLSNEAVVHIIANDKADHNNGKIWFDDIVELGDNFVLDPYLVGEHKLSSTTFIHIFDLSGNQLQEVEFHTSCSEPIAAGDTYGAVRIESWINKHGDVCGPVDGEEPTNTECEYFGEIEVSDYVLTTECIDIIFNGIQVDTFPCGVAPEENTELLRQTIALALNLIQNPSLGELPIEYISCHSEGLLFFTDITVFELWLEANACAPNCPDEVMYALAIELSMIYSQTVRLWRLVMESLCQTALGESEENAGEEDGLNSINLSPVPASYTMNVAFELAAAGEVTITIQDLNGQNYYFEQMYGEEGLNEININTAILQVGLYSISVITPDRVMTKQFMKI